MPDLHEMGFTMRVTAYDGEEYYYEEPEDMGLGGEEILQIKFDGGRRHHFDVEEIESIILDRESE